MENHKGIDGSLQREIIEKAKRILFDDQPSPFEMGTIEIEVDKKKVKFAAVDLEFSNGKAWVAKSIDGEVVLPALVEHIVVDKQLPKTKNE